MKTFKDQANNEWSLSVTIGGVLRVKAELGIDLLDMASSVPDDVPTLIEKTVDGKPVALSVMLLMDPALASNIAFHLMKSQTEKLGLDDYGFADRLDGGAAFELQRLLCEELTDFFQQSNRKSQVKILQTAARMLEAGTGAVERKIDRFDTETLIQQLVDKLDSGDTSGNSPASSAATPAATPSAS